MNDVLMSLLYSLAPRGMRPSQFRRIVELKEDIDARAALSEAQEGSSR